MFISYDRTYNQTDDIKEIPSVYIDTSNKNNIVMFMFLLQYENKNYITTESVDEATSSSPVFFTENSFQEESLINKFYPCCPEPYPALHYKSVLSLPPLFFLSMHILYFKYFRFKVQRGFRIGANGKEVNPSPVPAYKPEEN